MTAVAPRTICPAGKKFCGECGAALRPADAATPRVAGPRDTVAPIGVTRAVPPDEVPEGERKTVTALFGDIKGSMELIEDLDPEEARAVVDPALRLMIAAVQHYDGYIVRSTGDGIFALFGAPVAHEDHPQRALYAALRMQADLKRYSDRICAEGRVPIQVRVGVNTGEVALYADSIDEHLTIACASLRPQRECRCGYSPRRRVTLGRLSTSGEAVCPYRTSFAICEALQIAVGHETTLCLVLLEEPSE